ncbi:MAG: hypothetical protein GY757_34390 [bacterium]|nr:hypothetical protein [bacterium]
MKGLENIEIIKKNIEDAILIVVNRFDVVNPLVSPTLKLELTYDTKKEEGKKWKFRLLLGNKVTIKDVAVVSKAEHKKYNEIFKIES